MEIHLYDQSYVNVTTDLVSTVKIIRHSPECKIKKQGLVKIENKYVYLK